MATKSKVPVDPEQTGGNDSSPAVAAAAATSSMNANAARAKEQIETSLADAMTAMAVQQGHARGSGVKLSKKAIKEKVRQQFAAMTKETSEKDKKDSLEFRLHQTYTDFALNLQKICPSSAKVAFLLTTLSGLSFHLDFDARMQVLAQRWCDAAEKFADQVDARDLALFVNIDALGGTIFADLGAHEYVMDIMQDADVKKVFWDYIFAMNRLAGRIVERAQKKAEKLSKVSDTQAAQIAQIDQVMQMMGVTTKHNEEGGVDVDFAKLCNPDTLKTIIQRTKLAGQNMGNIDEESMQEAIKETMNSILS